MPSLSNLLFEAIDKGADINLSDDRGETLIFLAAQYGNLEIIRLLIEKGAEINLPNKQGETPIFQAARSKNLAIVRLLIEKGVEINLPNDRGETPIFQAARSKNLAIVRLLIERGAEINLPNNRGETPIFQAARSRNLAIVHLLIEKGAEINLPNNLRVTPIFLAALYEKLAIVCLLIEKGAEINLQNDRGETPIFQAAQSGNLEIVRLLIEKGAEINLQNSIKNEFFNYIVNYFPTEMVNLSIDTLLSQDINTKKPEIIRMKSEHSNYWDKRKSEMKFELRIIFEQRGKKISLRDFLTTKDDIDLVSFIRNEELCKNLEKIKHEIHSLPSRLYIKIESRIKEALSKSELHRTLEEKGLILKFVNPHLNHRSRVNLVEALCSASSHPFSKIQPVLISYDGSPTPQIPGSSVVSLSHCVLL